MTPLRTIGVRTLLGGGETFHDRGVFSRAKEEWFHTFLSLPHGLPSHDTFHRVCAALEPAQFAATFQTWTQTLRQASPPPPQLSPGAASLTFRETVEKDHGRIEIRRFARSPPPDGLEPRAA